MKTTKIYDIFSYVMFVLPPFIWGLVELYTMNSPRPVHMISLWVNLAILVAAAVIGYVFIRYKRLKKPDRANISQLGFGLVGNVLIYLYTFQNPLNLQNIVTIYVVLLLVLVAHYVLIKRRVSPLELWILMPLFIIIDYAHLLISGCGYGLFEGCDVSDANYLRLYLLYVAIVLAVFGYYGYRIYTYRRKDFYGILNLVLVVSLMVSLFKKLDLDEKIIGTLLILIFFFILLDLIVSIVNKTFTSKSILYYMRTMTLLFVWSLMMEQDFFNYGSPGRNMLIIMVIVTYVSLGINILKGLLKVEERYDVKRERGSEIVPYEETYLKQVLAYLSKREQEQVMLSDGSLSYIARKEEEVVGFIQVSIRIMPKPVEEKEAYVDIFWVGSDDEGKTARRLIDRVIDGIKHTGAMQIRAWSGVDQEEVIRRWKEMGFTLCPVMSGEERTSDAIEGFYAVKKVS
jgi:hypothetical protein